MMRERSERRCVEEEVLTQTLSSTGFLVPADGPLARAPSEKADEALYLGGCSVVWSCEVLKPVTVVVPTRKSELSRTYKGKGR